MINIKEFSIGNYVLHLGAAKKIGEIISFTEIVLFQEKYYGLHSNRVSINEIEPVPLTLEMLEKNGFIKNNNRWFYDAILECYEISIYEISEGIFKVEFRDLEFGISNAEITLCNVHQLQNFLTLCGIDKNIEL